MATGGNGPNKSLPAPTLRNYVVTEPLGQGAYGRVYKARGKTGPREVVAVKCVLRSQLTKSEADNLFTEIKLLKTMRHEHIVGLVDFCSDANYIYIIMEYCGGGDLSKFIKSRQRLSEATCKQFLQQLALALRFLRSKDVAHLDLKPSNILLVNASGSQKAPVLKLADFGLAQHFSEEEKRTGVRGSYLYMAPEICLGRKYDAKVDLWSVGVILFECLFGRAPFKSETEREMLLKIKEEKPIVMPRANNISKECYSLLEKCLRRDPARRIGFEEFFAHPFLDLEHVPNDESAAKARNLAARAVDEDARGNLESALKLYRQALEYYLPLERQERNETKKAALRQVSEKYISRAEEIKQELRPPPEERPPSRPNSREESRADCDIGQLQRQPSERTRLDELVQLGAATPRMRTALEIARTAEEYDLEGRYSVALEKYRMALEVLLAMVKGEPDGRRKKLLGAELKKWLERSEYISQALETQEKILAECSGTIDGCPNNNDCQDPRNSRRFYGPF